jgi:hypothetical protein
MSQDRIPRFIDSPAAVLHEQIDARAWIAELPNGHRLTAFATRRFPGQLSDITSGKKVILQISPADFSTGMITALVD